MPPIAGSTLPDCHSSCTFIAHIKAANTVIARRDPVERLDRHFRTLAGEAFARYGFAYADLIVQWPAMVGEVLAGVSRPERLRWPRPAPSTAGRKQGGTLVVRVAEGRALELQHLAPRIVERINAFYGYQAVAALKLVQGPLPARAMQRSPRVAPLPAAPCIGLDGIGDDRLKAALQRLAAVALPRQATSQHPTSNR